MKRKFTKGPWEAVSESLLVMKGHDAISCVYTNGTISAEEAEANANLIAAAPELLEALEAIVDYEFDLNTDGLLDDILKAGQAIKKAYGEKP